MSCEFRLFREIGESELSTKELYERILNSLEITAEFYQKMYEDDALSPFEYDCEMSAIRGRIDEIETFKNDREKLAREIEKSFNNQEYYYFNVGDSTNGLCYDDGKVYLRVPELDDYVYRYRTADKGLPNFPKNVIKSYDDYLKLMKEHSHLKCVDEEELVGYIKSNSVIAFFT